MSSLKEIADLFKSFNIEKVLITIKETVRKIKQIPSPMEKILIIIEVPPSKHSQQETRTHPPPFPKEYRRLSETFLKPHQNFHIPHYTIYRTERPTQGGGTTI